MLCRVDGIGEATGLNARNLFVLIGEPDIEIHTSEESLQVEIKGIDIFGPTTGELKSSQHNDIACWFIDTDYDQQAFYVRRAYFSGGGTDPFKQLKRALKSSGIDAHAWSSLYRTASPLFLVLPRGASR